MTPDQAPEPRSSVPGTDTRESTLDTFEDVLLDGLDFDERLQSGVPEAQRASDLDFIQMTGLGRPVLSQEDPMAPPPPDPRELDARRPLSFFEKGVADVDASMTPPALDVEDSLAEEIVPSFGPVREEAPPAIVLPEAQPASDYVTEPVKPERPESSFEFDDLDTSAPQCSEAIGDPLDVNRELSPRASEPASEDGFEELAPLESEPASRIDFDELAPPPMPAEGERFAAPPPLQTPPPPPLPPPAPPPPPLAVTKSILEDDLAELSQAVDRLKASPKSPPPPARPVTEAADDDWPGPEVTVVARTESPLGARDLAEAEQLLQELEYQPRDIAQLPADMGAAAKGKHVNTDGDDDESVYRQPRPTHRRRSDHRHSRLHRRIIRWVPRLVALVLVSVGGYVAYRQVMPLFEKPTASLERARQLKAAGRYKEASEAFAGFAATQHDELGRADAELQAAYCLQLAPAQSFDETQANRKRALKLFEQFVTDNPGHAKVARAKVRMGILHFDLGEFKEAVELLQDPSLQLADPESALPILRTLARARWKLGDYDAAESAFSQAAALASNYTPDQDYEELGDLDRWRAENAAADDAARQHYRAAAVENWTRALRVPTIDPAAKTKIRTKSDWFMGQTQGKLPQSGEQPPVALPVETAKPGDAPKPGDTAPSAAPAEQTPQGPNPQVEAQYPGTPPVSEAPQTPAPPPKDGKDEHATSSHS